tara:strand:- start:121 stop:546 length:426 start_codon:yes stop_codon:yes gene_type:complete
MGWRVWLVRVRTIIGEKMNNYVDTFYKNTLEFKGVACRKEYWLSMLQVYVVLILALFLSGFMYGASQNSEVTKAILLMIWTVVGLATMIASVSIGVRRVRDLGISGYFYLLLMCISVVPFIGWILQITALCLPTDALKGKL